MLGLLGNLCGGIFIERIRISFDRAIGDEQVGFREGRGCVDQIFAVRQMYIKYLGVRGKQ